MSTRVLVFASVLLASVHNVAAVARGVCGTANIVDTSSDTCTCPTGTTGVGATVSGSTYTAATANGVTTFTATSGTTTAANSLLGCTDLVAGYYLTAASTAPATCTGTGKYCLGKAGLYTTYPLTYAAGAVVYPSGATGATLALGGIAVCPPGFGNTASVTSVDETSCVDILPGYYQTGSVTSGAGGDMIAGTKVAACTAGYYCPGKTAVFVSGGSSVIAAASTWDGTSSSTGTLYTSANVAAASSNTAPNRIACGSNTLNFICPAGISGTATNAGSSIVTADLANINGEIFCGTGYAPDTGAANCVAKAGYYGASVNTGTGSPLTTAAATGCPAGITGATAQTTIAAACTDLNAGYAVLSAIAAQTTAGALTTLTAGITTCAINKYCPGAATVFSITGVSATTFTYAAVTVPAAGSGAPTACPTGTGNALTGTSAQGANAVSLSTACVDLLASYAFIASVSATTTLSSLIAQCAAGTYNCAGSAGLFVASPTTINTGLTATGSMVLTGGTPALTANVATASTGTLIKGTCPTGSTNTAAGATIASCLAQPGYYIDASGLSTPVACSVGEYCPGDGGQYLTSASALATASVPVGTAGGDYNCPAGSVAPGTAPSTSNSALNDCNLLPNFYIPTGTGAALYVPVSCPAGSHCPGGTAIGTAGGSFACPANSTIPACTVAAVTAPSVTVAAAAAPAVTVAAAAAPAVTVAAGAAPIVNFTAPSITISAAPRAAAHAAVLALTAVAALVAF